MNESIRSSAGLSFEDPRAELARRRSDRERWEGLKSRRAAAEEAKKEAEAEAALVAPRREDTVSEHHERVELLKGHYGRARAEAAEERSPSSR